MWLFRFVSVFLLFFVPLPSLVYTFSDSFPQCRSHVPSILRQWHRGMLLGFDLESLCVGGREIGERDLERLNLWIAAHGAWRCSAMSAIDAAQALEVVLRAPLRVPVAPHGAGRWQSFALLDRRNQNFVNELPRCSQRSTR